MKTAYFMDESQFFRILSTKTGLFMDGNYT